ncbi:hypothetical protein WA1_00870 [Scytonema hofmannii PCC 7110]|uniref:Activator of Hsp90 ATPase homologue 1/2-like C-terminal domain-containing protein n=1 Tax=Scytonema hofmannii PCC 7110 TaxID=128403 RepID=A0A139XGE6_9CYAN|nr:SRPBCC domain-containing protein [Scytonema hofmannii]KYC43749.1 hypothetical protein WA1_00870 [Scytonema hofmannii PCC 7110]
MTLTNGSDQSTGTVASNELNVLNFPSLENVDEKIPRLFAPEAQTIVRDRWERLVTSIDIPATAEDVWRALTDPDKLKLWLAVCHGSLEQLHSDCVLDFEDGEFFLCRSIAVKPLSQLQYVWRWLGIGQATTVTWQLESTEQGTRVTVIEEALNPPWDWQTWNGGGWPGILDQLAAYLRTKMEWRWPWRRMGPYVQIELPAPVYPAWDRLFNPASLKYWLLVMQGHIIPEQSLTILMGDASGTVQMTVHEVIQPGQTPPSFLPSINFSLSRPAWNSSVGGRCWLEPAGWGRSLFQVFHYGWENLPAGLQFSERKILTRFWADAIQRAGLMFRPQEIPGGPHNWS